MRKADGSAGDADYESIGIGYPDYRLPEPEWAAAILAALGDARTVLNVGAGAGSYEPTDRDVTAVEPSATMRANRPAHLPEAVDATAEDLPFADDSFDASMATFSVHQWGDLAVGLAELRRLTRGPVVLLTCDPDRLADYWLNDYAPEVIATEARRYPKPSAIAEHLGGHVSVTTLPIPLNCSDRINDAYYGRPEGLLAPGARLANSAWSFVGTDVEDRFVEHLSRDLESGAWDENWGHLRTQPHLDGALVMIVRRP